MSKSVVAHALVQITDNQSGVETYPIDCGGLTPKGAIFICGRSWNLGVKDGDLNVSVGATDLIHQWSVQRTDRDASATTFHVWAITNTFCVLIYGDGQASWIGAAKMSSFGPDSVTLDWGSGLTQPTEAYWLQIIAFAGDDVQCQSQPFQNEKEIGTEFFAPSIGFEPDFVFTCGPQFKSLNAGRTSDNPHTLGFVTNDRAGGITQGSFAVMGDHSVTTSDRRHKASDTRGSIASLATLYRDYDIEFTSFNSDGWGYTPRGYEYDRGMGYFNVSFGVDAPDIQTWSGFVDTPTSTGIASYTQPGFEPQFVFALPGPATVLDNTVYQTSDSGAWGYSCSSPTVQSCRSMAAENLVGTTNTQNITSAQSIVIHAGDGTEKYVATLDGMTADGWDWDFEKTDTLTVRKWLVVAFGTGIAIPNNLNIVASIEAIPALGEGI